MGVLVNEIRTQPACIPPARRRTLTASKAFENLWHSLWSAFFPALMVQILGGVALGLAGG